jgi:integrase
VAALRSIDAGRKGGPWALRGRKLRVPQATWWHALLGLGCRYGELRQVRWCDVDLAVRALTLRAETTKGNRERVVPIHADLAGRFRALREEHARVFGGVPGPRDLVFLTPNGTPWPVATTNLMRLHNRVLELAGVERVDAEGRTVDIHALRGAAASRLARQGVGLVQAARILGHADTRTTSRHYVRLGIEDLRSAAERLSPPVLRQTHDGAEEREATEHGRASG